MEREMDGSNGAPLRKKARKGKKKSKAERLSRGLHSNPTTTASPSGNHDGGDGDTTVSFEALQSLLASPDATTSTVWDRAQALAMRLATPQARQLLIRSLVFDRQAHKAAVHYARRLHIPHAELVDVLLESRDDALRCLAIARFLADADVGLIDNATRITQFLVPWLVLHEAHTIGTVKDAGEDASALTPPTLPSAFATAVRVVLQPNPTHKKPAMAVEKLALQRLLVKTLLAEQASEETPSHAGIVLQYASSLAAILYDAAAAVEDASPAPLEWWTHNAIAAEQQRRTAIASRVEALLQMLWPDAQVVLFGSSATSLLLPVAKASSLPTTSHDDVDLCVLLPSCPQFLDATAPLITDIKDHLALYVGDESDAVAVTRARVPIVKWTDAASQLQCDLCVNNVAALWNTQLTICLMQENPAVRTFSVWMKQWYKAHRHTSGFTAAISSYGLQLLVVHFLQHYGVLPPSIDCGPLTLDAETLRHPEMLDNIRKKVEQAIQTARTTSPPPTKKSTSLWSLVTSFFAFYGANTFDFEHDVVSVRGSKVRKTDKQWTRRHWRFSLSIEDPIETDRDLGSLFSRVSLTRFRLALVSVCEKIGEAYVAGEIATHETRERMLASLLADPDASVSPSK